MMPKEAHSPFVLASAGHIDHGKTMLIKTLTGIDTDRLKEEKERGISIELGFAHLMLHGGNTVDIIDVPGHERFIHTMVSGVTSIHAAMLIVACDESVMPQTREHVDILSLLAVKTGLIVLTKADMVTQEQKEKAVNDVNAFTQDTFLHNSPVIFTSSVTGEGMDELKKAITDLTKNVEERAATGKFFLPVDRVFTMKGFGTVVTGTLRLGIIHEGEMVEILPQGLKTTARGVQVHKGSVKEALPGQRTAVNLSGAQKESLSRGSVVAKPGFYSASQCFDAEVYALPHAEKPLKNRQLFHLHLGTLHTVCRMILLEKEQLHPGESSFAQFITDAPVVTYENDRFILRTYSPMSTVAGGRILNAHAQKHKRRDSQTLKQLQNISDGDKAAIFMEKMQKQGGMVSMEHVLKEIGWTQEEWSKEKSSLPLLELPGNFAIHHTPFQEFKERALALLHDFHKKYPERQGMRVEELKLKFPSISSEMFSILLEALDAQKHVRVLQGVTMLQDFRPSLSSGQNQLMQEIENRLRIAKFAAPSKAELIQNNPQSEKILQLLFESRKAVQVGELIYHGEALNEIKSTLLEFFKTQRELDVQEAKTLFNITRKYLIPLLEYLDSTGFTARAGNKRVLRKKQGTG